MAYRTSGVSPATTIGECLERKWMITVRCDGCARSVRVGSAWMHAQPADARLVDVAARLRCSVCGGDAGQLSTVNWRFGD